MSKKHKLLDKLLSKPKDMTFDEVKTLLISLGFEMLKGGKTGGSRVKFSNGDKIINLHKPHPRKELLPYQINQLIDKLQKEDLI